MSSPVSVSTKATAQKNTSWSNSNVGINTVNAPAGATAATTTTSATAATASGKEKGTRKVNAAGARQTHSRSYPRGVGLDFRKLAGISLINYIDHHGE
jgi:hypothetical protein